MANVKAFIVDDKGRITSLVHVDTKELASLRAKLSPGTTMEVVSPLGVGSFVS